MRTVSSYVSPRALTHIGLRTIKTALAVTLAIACALLRGSPAPIFAAIGAIVAMSRTLDDAVRACLTQIAAIICGVALACLFLAALPRYHELMAGVGVIFVIACCNFFHLEYAVSLACIVFASICLMDPSQNYFLYGLNRLLDTTIGLVLALGINLAVKPYNNRVKISRILSHIQQLFPGYLEERVLRGRYPDLAPLRAKLATLSQELKVFERQPPRGLRRRREAKAERRREAAYLRGCEQLLVKMSEELYALCSMDLSPAPGPRLCERLEGMGLTVPEELPHGRVGDSDRVVLDFHLSNLLDANDFLSDLNRMEALSGHAGQA